MELTIKQISCNQKYKDQMRNGGTGLLTLFTPSFNRAKFLPRLAECVENQTCKDFVWIIVNDGSKDNTDEVAGELLNRNKFPLMYISKLNGGKHSAFKVALEHCETSYFQCMDDDDLYNADAVNFFLRKWEEIKAKHMGHIGAIRTLARRHDGSYATNFPITKENDGKEYVATTLENTYVYHRIQENWTCYDTEKLKTVDLFPSDYWLSKQHKFFSEGIWQGRFARKYSCLFVYCAFHEYRNDDEVSLMRQIKSRQFYLDSFINKKIIIDEQFDYISRSLILLLKYVLSINWLRAYLKISFGELLYNTNNKVLKATYIIAYPLSIFNKIYINKLG